MSIGIRFFVCLLACVGIFQGGTTLIAQQKAAAPETSPDLLFKRTVRRVILDIVVTDKQGQPVRGLAAKDFSVKEDGQAQQILSFETHNFDAAYVPPKLPPLPPNTFVNVPTTPERGPLYVLLYDLVNTDMDDQATARKQMLEFIHDKPQGSRFAIFVLSDGLHLIQGFTEDPQQLEGALDPNSPRPHVPRIFLYGKNYGRGDISLMIWVFTDIAHFLDGLPGRKNLIWFAGKFPIQLEPLEDDPHDLRERITEATNAMVQAEVSIYPIDVRGVVVDNPHAASGSPGGDGGLDSDYRTGQPVPASSSTAPPANASTPSAGSTPFSGVTPAGGGAGYSLLASDYSTEDYIARQTGGRAFYSTNDLKGALSEATEIGGNYYTISYAPTNEDYDGKMRSIHVDLAEPGDNLAYRRTYFATNPDAENTDKGLVPNKPVADKGQPAATRQIGDSLYANMEYGSPLSHQLFFRAHVHTLGAPTPGTPEQMANLADQPAYFRARHKNKPAKPLPPIPLQKYVIDYTLATQAKAGSTAAHLRPPALEIAAAAFDSDGRMLNGIVNNTSSGQDAAPASADGIYRAEQEIDVPLKATSMRIAVRDMSTDHVGAMEITLPLAPEPPMSATR